MTRRTSGILGGTAVAAVAVLTVLARRGGDDAPARPVAEVPATTPADDGGMRTTLDPVGAASAASAESALPVGGPEVARRARVLLDEEIPRTEQRLTEARATGNAVLIRNLEVRLERLRAARDRRAGDRSSDTP